MLDDNFEVILSKSSTGVEMRRRREQMDLKRCMLGIATGLLMACAAVADTLPSAAGTQPSQSAAINPVVDNYSRLAAASYADSLSLTQALHAAIQQLVTQPSAETLQLARQAWLQARATYGQTEVYRFYGGPIDDIRGLEARINAWPVDEAYLDYVQTFDGSKLLYQGLINQPEQPITPAAVVAANERDGEKNISMGFHAIEFLLWGQDLYPDSPGRRDYQDYLSARHAERRGRYLLTISALLVEHLQQIEQDWSAAVTDNYRRHFLADPRSLTNMLTGMYVLAGNELAGERLEVALATRDQEDEHSCFSDNTHVDIAMNIQGIRNVFYGRYQTLDGTLIEGAGVADWLQRADPQAYQQTHTALDNAAALAQQLQPPFDQAIQDDSQLASLEKLIVQLRLFARVLKRVQLQPQTPADA